MAGGVTVVRAAAMTRGGRAATSSACHPMSVDQGEGWVSQKLGKVDQASQAAMGAE